MNLFKRVFNLSRTFLSPGNYYETLNWALRKVNGNYTMLHYPMYKSDSDNFLQAQKNLTDYCISLLKPLTGKAILEIGCGNGIQALYVYQTYNPLSITGIDLNEINIEIANREKGSIKTDKVRFIVDNAQELRQIPSDSIDIILNIESAFHYPDKSLFLREIYRVLKPGGQYLIADILYKREKKKGPLIHYHKRMNYHHWDYDHYAEEFLNSGLINNFFEDISIHVSKGFRLYRKWLPEIKWNSFFQDIALRIFYIYNVRMNLYLLTTKRRCYCIFVGNKPIDSSKSEIKYTSGI